MDGWPLPNVWMGVSVEDQATADERLPLLLQTPAAVRFVSYEPALGPVDFLSYLRLRIQTNGWNGPKHVHELPAVGGSCGLDWIIVGGESGPGARPFDVAWARSTVEQGREAGVPVFVKQLGAAPVSIEDLDHEETPFGAVVLHDPKGGEPGEWPEDLRVREFPEAVVRHG